VGNAKRLTGRTSTVSAEIKEYFVELVRTVCTPNTLSTWDNSHRTHKNFNKELFAKFGMNPTAKQLSTIISNEGLTYLLKSKAFGDVEPSDKLIRHCKEEEVGKVWHMDGSWSKTIEILDANGQWKAFEVIGIVDAGSRYKLGHKAYFSESGFNSIHFIKHVLSTNRIPKGTSSQSFNIELKPDNGSGFLKLDFLEQFAAKHWAHTHRIKFAMIPFQAGKNAGKKTEPSWNGLHRDLEFDILQKFKDKVTDFKGKRQSKNGINQEMFVRRIAITLDELNESEVIQDYIARINNETRAFRMNGVATKANPQQLWDDLIARQGWTSMTEADFKHMNIFAVNKESGYSVKNDGTIAYKSRIWQVTDKTLFTAKRTAVRVGLLEDGRLGIFNDTVDKKENGTDLLCYALASVAPNAEGVAHVEDKKLAKFKKQDEMAVIALNEQAIFKLFEVISLPILTVEKRLEKLRAHIARGLNEAMTQEIISSDVSIRFYDGTPENDDKRFSYFDNDAIEILRKSSIKLVRNAL